MIAYLTGVIKFIFEDYCVLDVSGVGYKVFANVKGLRVGEIAEFYIHTAVRDDAINLYGFSEREEFELFEKLLNVTGVGAKGALTIASKIAPSEIANAIARQDVKALTRIQGVGKKTAERILLELKDKIQTMSTNATVNDTAQIEAAEALEALGYTMAEIREVLAKAPPDSTTEDLIKFALKKL